MKLRIMGALWAAVVAGGATASWFGIALLRFVTRMSGNLADAPSPWSGEWLMEVWCPAASASTAACLIWLAISWRNRLPSIWRGALTGVGTVFLAPVLCVHVFWRVVITFHLIQVANLSGLIAMMTNEGAWPVAAPIAAILGGLMGWWIGRGRSGVAIENNVF